MKLLKIFSLLLLILDLVSCKKIIKIQPPVGTVTTSQVFDNDAQAISAATGIYYQMINTDQSFLNSGMTIFGGMSADELIPYDQNINDLYAQFQQNSLVYTNRLLTNNLWGNLYSIIYISNAILDGLNLSKNVHDSVKNELIGEAEFSRAFCNFYLVNLFGDIPLVNSINWHKTTSLPRTPIADVYTSIIDDLEDAKLRLLESYDAGKGERIIPNKWAARALLARTYLYTGNWDKAIEESSAIISNRSLFNLCPDLNEVFLANSSETIWQLQQNSNGSSYSATPEGFILIPRDSTFQPFAYLTNNIIDSFEPSDQRKSNWTKKIPYNGTNYLIPYKYKDGPSEAIPGGSIREYYMVLRLSEQYLIRAEAEANKNELADAASDLNIIRMRANLSETTAVNQSDLINAILHERQIELFSEWGHRWLDLKRTNKATTILQPIKPLWSSTDQLYPIPQAELLTGANLTQNPGY